MINFDMPPGGLAQALYRYLYQLTEKLNLLTGLLEKRGSLSERQTEGLSIAGRDGAEFTAEWVRQDNTVWPYEGKVLVNSAAVITATAEIPAGTKLTIGAVEELDPRYTVAVMIYAVGPVPMTGVIESDGDIVVKPMEPLPAGPHKIYLATEYKVRPKEGAL